jgi:hypothetical protein
MLYDNQTQQTAIRYFNDRRSGYGSPSVSLRSASVPTARRLSARRPEAGAKAPVSGSQPTDQLLTTYVATNLYWFGRHLQRIESTLIDVLAIFDVVIDTDKRAGKRYFEHLEIDLEYESASQFMTAALFGDHPSNLGELMLNARENAVTCRAHLDADAFGETIRLYNLIKLHSKRDAVDYRFIGEALSLINEIWGIMSRGLIRRKSDYFIRLGKLVEKVDLHLRLGKDGNDSIVYLHNILITAQRIAPHAEMPISETDEEANLDAINGLIDCLVVA